jgi:hypothetical protein
LASLDFCGSTLDDLFVVAIVAIVRGKNKVALLNLKDAKLSEDSLKLLKSFKLKTEKTLNITLPDGENLQITEREPERVEKPLNVRKQGTSK